MNMQLKDVLAAAEKLPETDQQELALQVEEMIVARKIAASEMAIAAGRVTPLDIAFDQLEGKYAR